jgi:hypothetical protein
VIENLPSKHEALRPNSSPTEKKYSSHSFHQLSKYIAVAVIIGWQQNKKNEDCFLRKNLDIHIPQISKNV